MTDSTANGPESASTEDGHESEDDELDASTHEDRTDSALDEKGNAETGSDDTGRPGRDPVRIATLAVLALCVLFFVLYVRADRVMPYTDQARVSGYTVAVVPQVSGYITDIPVSLHQVVHRGQVLVQIDTQSYQIGVRSARAQLDNVVQQISGQSAAVEAAAAKVAAVRAQEDISKREFERIESIRERDEAAISQSDRDRAEAAWLGAVAQVEAAQADVRRLEATLGPVGAANPSVRAAMAGLEQAELNLARTSIRAPSAGAIESLELGVGHFAAAGQALMTFVSTADVWIEADLRENNLANLAPGTPVEILLDAAPGEIFDGVIRSVGLGVGGGIQSSRGSLPSVSQQKGWLRQPQQFPVVIDLADDVPKELLRIGAQASVMVYTGRHPVLNPIGRVLMRFYSLLSYVR